MIFRAGHGETEFITHWASSCLSRATSTCLSTVVQALRNFEAAPSYHHYGTEIPELVIEWDDDTIGIRYWPDDISLIKPAPETISLSR